MTIQVEEIMNTQLFTLSPTSTLAQAKEVMADHSIRHIPIVDESNNLAGLVTHRDLLASGGMDTTLKDHIPLENIITTPPYTINPKTGVKQAAELIQREKFGCLPVIKHGKLVGLLTATDFVAVAITLVEMIEMSEPEPIEAEQV